jgi:hypothetical protein
MNEFVDETKGGKLPKWKMGEAVKVEGGKV